MSRFVWPVVVSVLLFGGAVYVAQFAMGLYESGHPHRNDRKPKEHGEISAYIHAASYRAAWVVVAVYWAALLLRSTAH